jgi:hypothetical protein
VWTWVKADDTTTSSAGQYVFADALELEDGDDEVDDVDCLPSADCYEEDDEYAYRLKIFVEEPGNTVSYVSESFTADCHVALDFTILKNIWDDELALNTGAWCYPMVESDVCWQETLKATTDSTGWYRIQDEPLEGTYKWRAKKTGFATCTEPKTLLCNDQVYWNPELRCQDITFTILVTQEDQALPVQGASVNVDWTFDATNLDVCVDDTDIEDMTDSDGHADFANGLQTKDGDGVVVTIEKDGYDPKTVTAPDVTTGFDVADFYECALVMGTATDVDYEIELCAYFTFFGQATDGTDPYAGYWVTAEGKATGVMVTPNQPFGDMTDAFGNFALEISKAAVRADNAGGEFYLRLYSPSGVLVWQQLYDLDAPILCGEQYNESFATP